MTLSRTWPLAPAGTNLPVWLIQNRLRVRDLDAKGELPLPSCGTIVWLVGDEQSRRELRAINGSEESRYFISTPAKPGMHLKIGRYRLASSPEPCPAARH